MADWTRPVGAAAMLAALVWCGPAMAWTGVVSWPSYYRTGPDKHYEVLDELDRGLTVEVLSCDNGWCRIQTNRTTGYLEQAVISKPEELKPMPPTQAQSDGCFDSHETGYGKGDTWHYCPR